MEAEPREEATDDQPEDVGGSSLASSAMVGERPRRRNSRFSRRRVCPMCADKMDVVDYKDVNFLRRFVSDRARIEPRRKAGTCAKHQRAVARALKRARHVAILPFAPGHVRRGGVLPPR